jgi:phage terminase large subunit-like protein
MAAIHPQDHAVSVYARDVLAGRETAGDLVRLACERHLRDLDHAADRGLIFDTQRADMAINFAKMIRHTTGPMAGKPLELRPWQVFRHGSVFGWLSASTGLRRFRTAYHQVAKKNGKTTDTAPPALFTQLFDGEAAPQGFCAATSRDQAGLLFQEIKRMVQASPALSQLLRPWRHMVESPNTNGSIRCLSRDGNSADGINPHFAAMDEVHRWTDRELFEVVRNSMLARAQPILWAITTAGADMTSVCGELRAYSEKVLRGDVQDDAFFAYVAEPPRDADAGDRNAWMMANPNFGHAFKEDDFAQIYREAAAITGKMPNFRRLHLNLWTEGAEAWIDKVTWDMGAKPFDLSELAGLPAWVGVDLSRSQDMTAITVAVEKDGEVYVICYSFLPAGPQGFMVRAQKENRDYIGWRDRGWLEVHHGGVIDDDAIIRRLIEIREAFDLQELAFDRWGSKYMVKRLTELRFPLVEHGQGYASMSAPMKEVEKLVLQGRLRHNGNPVLSWAVGNVHRDEDPAGNIKPNKARSTGRIDPAVATIMAVGRAVAAKRKRKIEKVLIV